MPKAWNLGGNNPSPKFDGFIVAFGGGWEGAEDYSKNYFLKKSPLYPNKFQLALLDLLQKMIKTCQQRSALQISTRSVKAETF